MAASKTEYRCLQVTAKQSNQANGGKFTSEHTEQQGTKLVTTVNVREEYDDGMLN